MRNPLSSSLLYRRVIIVFIFFATTGLNRKPISARFKVLKFPSSTTHSLDYLLLHPSLSRTLITKPQRSFCINSIPIFLRITQTLAHSNSSIPLLLQPLQHMLNQHFCSLLMDIMCYDEKIICGGGLLSNGGVEYLDGILDS